MANKSWRAPLIIILALMAGIGFALAHHLMGKHLDGKPVDKILVPQAWISRISTALAFAVKVALAISVGTAYVQHQWLRFHKQSFKTEDVDALTSVLGNALSFTGSLVWLRHPLLTLMALISWSIPLATITAPGSLTVAPLSFNNTITDLNVPQLQLDNFEMFKYLPTRANPEINKLVARVAIAGELTPLASSFSNETYHRYFYAPAIRCGAPSNASLVRNVSIEISETARSGREFFFISWVGREDDFPLDEVNLGTLGFSSETLDTYSEPGARIFVVTTGGASNISYIHTSPMYAAATWPAPQVSVVECVLHNASYSVNSTFRHPLQSHEVAISHWLDPIGFKDRISMSLDGRIEGGERDAYLSLMGSFGKLLVGIGYCDRVQSNEGRLSSYALLNIDWESRPTIPRKLEQLFQNITLGLLSDSRLTKNPSIADPVNATVETWQITYVYTEYGLLLAYGIIILCTFVCALVGFYASFVNDASYQNIFSTFLRATNDLEVRAHISSGDMGSDPLPKDLAKTAVTFSGRDAADATVYSVAGKAESGDVELQHLRPNGTETSWDRGSSVGRESFESASAVRGHDSSVSVTAGS